MLYLSFDVSSFFTFCREQVELALQYLALSQVVARGPGKKNVLRKRKYISKVGEGVIIFIHQTRYKSLQ